jgi:hypothetical protein
MSTGLSQYRNTKHILTKVAYATQLQNQKILDIVHLGTEDMWADMLTKPMGTKPMGTMLCKGLEV